MKVSSILSLSVKNIFLKKFAYLKVLAGFFFSFLVIFIVLFYSGSLSIAYNDYEDINANYLVYEIQSDLSEEQEKEIRAFPQVKSIYSYTTLSSVYDSETEISIGGEAYVIGRKEYSFTGSYIGQNSDYTYCENELISFTSESGEQYLLYGDTLKSKDDIIISESVLNYLNIEERSSLIGKEIVINGVRYGEWTDDEREQVPYTKSGVICGISNGNFGYRYICFNDENTPVTKTEISLNNFTGNEDFFAKMDDMFGDDISRYFYGQYMLDDMKTVEGQEMLCNRFLSIICTVLLAVIAIYVASNQYYLLIKNSVFYGILKANGVSNREVFLMHMFELAITLIVALILSFGVSVGAFFVIKTLFHILLYIDLVFPVGAAIASFFGFFALCVLLALAITLFVYNKILKKPPVGLLKK